MFFLVSLYLMKFATDILLISPVMMGFIFGLSRIWDAITDPLAGYSVIEQIFLWADAVPG